VQKVCGFENESPTNPVVIEIEKIFLLLQA
jgi:hypothetical protein